MTPMWMSWDISRTEILEQKLPEKNNNNNNNIVTDTNTKIKPKQTVKQVRKLHWLHCRVEVHLATGAGRHAPEGVDAHHLEVEPESLVHYVGPTTTSAAAAAIRGRVW